MKRSHALQTSVTEEPRCIFDVVDIDICKIILHKLVPTSQLYDYWECSNRYRDEIRFRFERVKIPIHGPLEQKIWNPTDVPYLEERKFKSYFRWQGAALVSTSKFLWSRRIELLLFVKPYYKFGTISLYIETIEAFLEQSKQ